MEDNQPSDTVGLAAINQVVITPGRDAYCNGYLRSLSDLFLIEGVMNHAPWIRRLHF